MGHENAVETIESGEGHFTGYIYPEEYADNPREEFDNFSTMVCEHRRYQLGDKHDYDLSDCHTAGDIRKVIEAQEGPCLLLPLYLYEHGGITIRTKPFYDPWDSGLIGVVFVSYAKIREEYGTRRVTKRVLEQAGKAIQAEVETYDQYLSGQVYWFAIENGSGDIVDSCGGFYGSEYITEQVNEILEGLECEYADLEADLAEAAY